MGEVRQRKRKYCTVCQRTATPACAEARHPIKVTVYRTWWIRYYRNGLRYEESTEQTNKAEAERLLKLKEGEVAKGVPVTPKMGQLRFEEAAADFLTDYRVNRKRSYPNTKRQIELHLAPWFRGRRMAALTTADVNAYIADRQKSGAANGSINRELQTFRRMFTLAIRGAKLLHRPYVPRLAEHNVRKGFFERPQFEAVRRHLPAPLDAMATVAYYTGWRMKSEILTLQWHQVDRVAGVLRLEPGTTKNRDGRLFKYGEIDELRTAIDGLWESHLALARAEILCPWVFHHAAWDRAAKVRRQGRPIQNPYKAWRTACEAAGCPGRIPHDFRRTAVRNLTRAGVTDTVAMKVTGHKTRCVFDRYDITSEEDLADASRKLQALADAMKTGANPPTGTTGGTQPAAAASGNSAVENSLAGTEGVSTGSASMVGQSITERRARVAKRLPQKGLGMARADLRSPVAPALLKHVS
jgi:integrase